MISVSLPSLVGNVCAGIAVVLCVFPLHRLLVAYADRFVDDDRWTASACRVLVPQWLLLMGALLCMAITGGFDWLDLGRTAPAVLAVAAAIALAVVSFVAIALYIRPGFTPRFLYVPAIYGVPLATVLLVVSSLNRELVPGFVGMANWLRWPWTVFTGLSMTVCILFFGRRALRMGVGGVMGIAHRIRNPGPSTSDTLAKIAAFDAERDFAELMQVAGWYSHHEVCAAALAKMRLHPSFVERFAVALAEGYFEPTVAFFCRAALTAEELQQLARPAYTGMERWVERIPPPNCTTKQNLDRLRRFGSKTFDAVVGKCSGTGVDFGPVLAEFRARVEARR